MSWAPAFLSNPDRFMAFSRWAAPMFGVIAIVLAVVGLYLGFTAPDDYQQGQTVRIMFIHVPAAWLSMFVYVCLAVTMNEGTMNSAYLKSNMISPAPRGQRPPRPCAARLRRECGPATASRTRTCRRGP